MSVPAFWPMAMATAMLKEGTELFAKNVKFAEEEIKIHDELRPTLATPNQVRLDLRTMVLREYGKPGGIPALIDAPYAGHTAMIADYHKGQSLFAIGAAINVPFWQDFIFSIGIIVAMVPEGLLPTLTLALVLAAQRMAKRNVLIRHLTSVETLGAATVICTDKTGTLTENRMRVRELLLGCDRYLVNALEGAKGTYIVEHYRDFFACAALCHDLTDAESDGRRVLLGDPMEVALVEMGRKALPEPPASHRLDEVSFDADRMRHSVVQSGPEGPILFCKGAPESVLQLCAHICDDGDVRPLDAVTREAIVHAQEEMAKRGFRVLAFTSRKLPAIYEHDTLEQDLVFQGLVGLEDPPRREVPDAIRKCHEAGIKVIMVTGDHPRTATAIAREIGLVRSQDPVVIGGEQLHLYS